MSQTQNLGDQALFKKLKNEVEDLISYKMINELKND